MKYFATALLAAFGMTQVGAADYKPTTIRAATANPEGSVHTTAINKFKEIVEAESGGKIKVQTFYGGSMGDEQANVRQLRNQIFNESRMDQFSSQTLQGQGKEPPDIAMQVLNRTLLRIIDNVNRLKFGV